MKDYTSWMEAAAEEAMKMAIRSSMDVCSQMRKDADNKEDVDHDKLDALQHCWEIIHLIKHAVEPSKDQQA